MNINGLSYRNGELFVEDVAVRALADKHGTPLFVYSRAHLLAQYRALAGAMAAAQPLICYSVKTNSNAAVIGTFAAEGAGADVVSGGELFRARRAGVPVEKIVFAGVGKTEDDIRLALCEGILFFTVESEPELERISACAQAMGRTARVAVRVNPDVDPQTHKYISTGRKENKFGMDIERAGRALELALRLPGIEIAGVHIHIGSQILSEQPFHEAAQKIAGFCRDWRTRCATFRWLDIGGGIGIQYKPGQHPLAPEKFAAALLPVIAPLDLRIVMEPGRFLVGNAGILIARVQYVKDHPLKKFVIVDAGMNDLIRPCLYEAHHEIISVRETADKFFGDVVGPICESSDFLARDRELPQVRQGDLLAVLSAGAYGFAMASSYNSRPRAAEVLVNGAQSAVIRVRETHEDLVRHERAPGWTA